MNNEIKRLIRQSVKEKDINSKILTLNSANGKLTNLIKKCIVKISNSINHNSQFSYKSKMSQCQRKIAKKRIIRLKNILNLLMQEGI